MPAISMYLCMLDLYAHKLACTGSAHYEPGLNFMAFFIVLLNRSVTYLNGAELSFSPYRHDNDLAKIFPLKGKVTGYITLSAEDDWMLVHLNKIFRYRDMNIEYVLIKRSDKQAIVPGKSNQLVHFKMVPDLSLIRENNDKADFPFEVWALCK